MSTRSLESTNDNRLMDVTVDRAEGNVVKSKEVKSKLLAEIK